MKKIFITFISVLLLNSCYNPAISNDFNWIEVQFGYLIMNKKGRFFISSKNLKIEDYENKSIEENLSKCQNLRRIHFNYGLNNYALVKYYYQKRNSLGINLSFKCINEKSIVLPVYLTFKKDYKNELYIDRYCDFNKKRNLSLQIISIKPINQSDFIELEKIRDNLSVDSEDYRRWLDQA